MDGKLTTTSTTATQIGTADAGVDQSLVAEFIYDSADPFAVTMSVHAPSGPVRWTFARDLLLEGQYEPTGDGDVHVWPCLSSSGEAVVIVELCAPAGETLLQFPTRSIQDFVFASLDVVSKGAEQVDVDGWLEQLLPADAGS